MTLTTSLIDPWSGPYGGLPPFDTATPAAIEAATLAALELKRGEIAVIVDHPAPPDFENTIAALEDAGRPLKRLASLAAILEFNYGRRRQKRNIPLFPQPEKNGQWGGIILKINGMMN